MRKHLPVETVRAIKEASVDLLTAGITESGDYDSLMVMTNRSGRAVATLRAVLESIPEEQRY